MGFSECEWVLTHHGGSGRDGLDHTHLTVNLVQRDGEPAKVGHDYRRAQAACGAISRELALTELAGQQRHMPAPERRRVAPRKLTQGIRHELAQRGSAAGGERQTYASLREQGVLVRKARGGEAFALSERPDVWVAASDLIGRIDEHWAAHELENQEQRRGEPAAVPRPQQEKREQARPSAPVARVYTAPSSAPDGDIGR